MSSGGCDRHFARAFRERVEGYASSWPFFFGTRSEKHCAHPRFYGYDEA